ncbi:MAG: diguanylate cyclase [Thermodesulfobacteriota bacterium]
MLDELTGFLDFVQASVIILDQSYGIIFANKAACSMTGRPPSFSGHSDTCFSFLFRETDPCKNCPLDEDTNQENWEQSVIIPRGSGEFIYARRFIADWQDYKVITLQDVTREITLLRSLELNRKEQQAKNVLLERRGKEILSEQKLLQGILDYLPEAVVSVRGSFEIDRKNKALDNIFPGRDAQRCYELLGNTRPCSDCPAREGFAGLNDIRKSHSIGGYYITESITASPFGSGGLLVFRDTSRQIKLIEQIRQQRETILRKNQIMGNLADMGAMMQKDPNHNKVIEFFWEVLFSFIDIKKAILLVNDIRVGTIWLTSHREATEEEIRELSRKYLSRDIQNQHKRTIDIELESCRQTMPLFFQGRVGSLVGLLLLGGEQFGDREEIELIDLFTEPLGAYLENCLLSRKLEEKANTDPLTGLYNRGYLDQALDYEHDKFIELNIHYAIVAADVNLLKKVNDSYGHEAGDRLILKVSQLLESEVRSTDIVARIGGDEFVILLPEAGDDAAYSFVRRMEEDVFNGVYITMEDGEHFPVAVSFGSAGSDRYSSIDRMLKEADRLMYQAKEKFYEEFEKYR